MMFRFADGRCAAQTYVSKANDSGGTAPEQHHEQCNARHNGQHRVFKKAVRDKSDEIEGVERNHYRHP